MKLYEFMNYELYEFSSNTFTIYTYLYTYFSIIHLYTINKI